MILVHFVNQSMPFCRRIFLQFEAVGSAFYCWVNGSMVGYAQDTFLSSEFDVTELLKPGSNHLAVQASSVVLVALSACTAQRRQWLFRCPWPTYCHQGLSPQALHFGANGRCACISCISLAGILYLTAGLTHVSQAS